MEKKKKGLALKIISTILLVFAMYNQYSFSFYYSSGSALMVILGLLSIEAVAIVMMVATWNNSLKLRRIAYIIYAAIGLIWCIRDFGILYETMAASYTLLVLGAFTDIVVGILLYFSAKKFNIGWGIGIFICLYLEWISSYSCLLIQIPLIIACALVNINGTFIQKSMLKNEVVQETQE